MHFIQHINLYWLSFELLVGAIVIILLLSAQARQFVWRLWLSWRSNPYFVTAWTLFAGAFGKQLYTVSQTGNFSWSLKSWEQMVAAAALTAAIALIHLYIPAPGATPVK